MEILKTVKTKTYDTTVNVIGSLKDCNVIYSAMHAHFSISDSFGNLINQRNEFNLRTEKSRSRIEAAVNKAFLQFYNQEHKDLLKSVLSKDVLPHDKNFLLIWQFSLNNKLFREITSKVFAATYFSGRAGIKKDDITAYIKEFIITNKSELKWTENTITMIAMKYLSFMSKLNFVTAGYKNLYNNVKPSSEALVLFLYIAKLFSPQSSNILENDLLPICFITAEDIKDRIKRLSLKGFFNMSFNGIALNIELIHSYKGICDVLYN